MPDPRTLVLLRHGETDWNAQGRAQGHADVPLNAVGRAQAETVAPVLAAFEPARLWSSDLARALQTAEYVAAATGLAIEPDARLREYDVGQRSGLTLAEFAARLPRGVRRVGRARTRRSGCRGRSRPRRSATGSFPRCTTAWPLSGRARPASWCSTVPA